MSKQPEALRLASIQALAAGTDWRMPRDEYVATCSELRRLHALNAELMTGPVAVACLSRAFDTWQKQSDRKADLLGFFCNEWNAAVKAKAEQS